MITVMGRALTVLVAPGSFKESLDSPHVAQYISIGLRKASKTFNIVELPLADGGTGTCTVLTNAYGGTFIRRRVYGPLGKKVTARYGWIPRKRLAVIELAEAAGLHRVSKKQRNPCKTTTRGVGELIQHAVTKGCKKIVLGVGDSATIDCGVGALSVLGIRFLDKDKNEIVHNCQGLLDLVTIDASYARYSNLPVKIVIAADVTNVLTGRNGALVYARQKGATTRMIPLINKGLKNFKKVVKKQYRIDVDTIPGAGAAGGIPAAFHAILNAQVKPGSELVAGAVQLKQKLKQADVIITGEGRIDKQSLRGKTVGKVIEIAQEYKKPVVVVAGSIAREVRRFKKRGVITYYRLAKSGISMTETTKNTPRLLQKTAYNIGKGLLRK